jgi:tetratricopeptide (TPR) repeat protein
MPLRTLLEHLANPLGVLVGGAQDLPVRQRTLRATLDWSYGLLDTRQQALFRRLGVFAGGCSLEAAKAVADPNADLTSEVIDGLEALVDQSLLWQYGMSEDVARFSMLETVREYALDQLLANGELPMLRQRQASYFLSFAEAAVNELHGAQQREWLARLESEHDNLRFALTEPVTDAETDPRLGLVAALWPFWVAHGYLAEARHHAERALIIEASGARIHRARVLNGAAVLAWHQGDYDLARRRLEESLLLSQASASDATTAEALKWLGNTATMTGHPIEALDFYQRSSALFEQLGDNSGVIDARANLAIIFRRTGRYDEALQEAGHCLELRQQTGHVWGIASSLNNIGEIHRSRGDPAAAIPSFQQAIDTWESIGDSLGVAVGRTGLGIARVESGQTAEGLANLVEAEARFKALNSTTYLPELHRYLAVAALESGDIVGAMQEAARSLEFATAAGARDQEAMTQRTLGQIALRQGDLEFAQRFLESSRQGLAETGEIGELGRTDALLLSVRSIAGRGEASEPQVQFERTASPATKPRI